MTNVTFVGVWTTFSLRRGKKGRVQKSPSVVFLKRLREMVQGYRSSKLCRPSSFSPWFGPNFIHRIHVRPTILRSSLVREQDGNCFQGPSLRFILGRSGISSPKNGRRANLVKNNPFLWPSESWNDVTQLLLMLCHLSISVLFFLFITCILLCVLFSYLFLFSHSGHSLEKLPKSLILASKTGWNLAIFSAKIPSFEQNNHSKDETFSGDF